MYEEFYLDRKYVPEVFRKVDRIMDKQIPKGPKKVDPFVKPMPQIKGIPGVVGPLYVTEDWYIKRKKEIAAERTKQKKDWQIEMMQLIAQKDLLRYKLGKLNPGKKKDAKRIASINIRIKDIEADIRMHEEFSGVKIEELDHGTKLGKFCGKFKWIGKKIKKSIKKFYRKHEEIITNIASIVLPFLATFLFKKAVNNV